MSLSQSRQGTGLRPRLARLRGLLPGLLACLAVAAAALTVQSLEERLWGRAWLESVALSILIGAGIRTLWTPGEAVRRGVRFCARTLLEVAVVLLGASVSLGVLLSVGAPLLLGIVGVVVAAIGLGYLLGRGLGLPHRTAVLVACGNSICGNSAIAAVAPVIEAEGEEVATTIAFTAVLGVLAVLLLPLLGRSLHMSGFQYGALAGLTVYAVPQVLAATAPMGTTAVQAGALVKLCRVLMLGPVSFALSLHAAGRRRAAPKEEEGACRRLPLRQAVPWFVLGFGVLAAARSLGLLPPSVLAMAAGAASALTVISMAALGLETDLGAVARAGVRVAAAAVVSLVLLGAISLGLIYALKLV